MLAQAVGALLSTLPKAIGLWNVGTVVGVSWVGVRPKCARPGWECSLGPPRRVNHVIKRVEAMAECRRRSGADSV